MNRVYETLKEHKYLVCGTVVAFTVGVGVVYYIRTKKSGNKKLVYQLSDDKLESVSGDEETSPKERAISAKNTGNKYFKGGNYSKSIDCYTKALDLCPMEFNEDRATFYQNRAAAYENLKNLGDALADCSSALKCFPRYVKALGRRARLFEELGSYKEALEEITAVCILEEFKNQETIMRADRLLKRVGKEEFENEQHTFQFILQSDAYIKTFFTSFSCDPFWKQKALYEQAIKESRQHTDNGQVAETLDDRTVASLIPDEVSPFNGDTNNLQEHHVTALDKLGLSVLIPGTLELLDAVDFMFNGSNDKCLEYLSVAVDKIAEVNPKTANVIKTQIKITLLHGTYCMLNGSNEEALIDFDFTLSREGKDHADIPEKVNALIKKAGVLLIDSNDTSKCLSLFSEAEKLFPDCSDIYHHRGQCFLVDDKCELAVKDLSKAIQLSPDSSISQCQKIFAEARLLAMHGKVTELQKVFVEFKNVVDKFPNCIETKILYAKAICEQQMFSEAERYIDEAIQLEPTSGNAYVHKAILFLSSRNDSNGALTLLEKAVKVDPKCSFAYETLASVYVQMGRLTEAIDNFGHAINCAKTDAERTQLLSTREAVKAQISIAARFHMTMQQIVAVAMGGMQNAQMAQSGPMPYDQ